MRFREALTPDLDSEAEFEVQTQVVRSLGLQRRFDEATRHLEALKARLGTMPARVQARWHLERGRVLNSWSRPDQAVPFFQEAVTCAREGGDEYLLVDALHMLGISSEPKDRLAWHMAAIEASENSSSARAKLWMASLLNNTAWTLHDEGRFDLALELFQKALDERIRREQPRETGIARWAVARCLRSMGRHGEAIAILGELDVGDGYVHEELGENLLSIGESAKAALAFRQAFNLLSKDVWLVENEPKRLERLERLASAAA